MAANKKLMLSLPNRDSVLIKDELRLENLDLSSLSFHQVAREGDVTLMVKKLQSMTKVQLQRNISKRDKDRHTPLHYAARYNHFEMCNVLIEHGANIHALGEDNMTPLHLVAKYKPMQKTDVTAEEEEGNQQAEDVEEEDTSAEDKRQEEANIEILQYFITLGADPNKRDFYGLTPLHHACLRGNLSVVQYLLKCPNIAIEAVDQQKMTPLHISAIYGHKEIAKLLIEKGASIICLDEEQETPLHLACDEGNIQILKLIIKEAEFQDRGEFKEILTRKDLNGNTPLHLAVESGHYECCQVLTQKYKNFNMTENLDMQRNNGEAPIHLAASKGHLQILTLLIQNGARINVRDDDMSTPLILASKFNQRTIVEHLLECGAKLKSSDVDGFTALLIAANYGHEEIVKVLIENGAKLSNVDKNDRSALHQCAMENRPEALRELLKHKKAVRMIDSPDRYGNTPLHTCSEFGNVEILKIFLERECTLDLKNEDEQTALHLAAINGRVNVIAALVSKDKNVINDDDEDANTALHLAALNGREVCVKELIDLGANITARNAKQWTPLDCCAFAGHKKCAIVLLESDSPVDPKDKRKITPLHLACKHGHVEMTKILLKWNADVSLRAIDGRNALDYAVDHGHEDCAMLIVKDDHWKDAMRNRTKDPGTNEWTVTPMRKLIRKMPYVAEHVLRRCCEENNKHPDHIEYKITFDYEFLDDEYSCTNWVEFNDAATETSMPALSLNEPSQIYNEEGFVMKHATPYTDNSYMVMSNHPLFVMARSKRANLLKHPLVLSLLNHKWKAYGRKLYYTNLLIYTVFMVVLNTYMIIVPPPYVANQTTSTVTCLKVNDAAVKIWKWMTNESGCTDGFKGWQVPASYIVLVLASINFLKELFQIISQKFRYFLSITNLMELCVYILSILLVINVSELNRNNGLREAWQWQCGAVAVFFSWFGLVMFIQNFPRFGIFVIMFNHVLITFASFIGVFMLFILAFAFSFHALFQNRFAFERWWTSIIKTIVMMIGEFEYSALFDEQETSTDYTSDVFYDGLSYALFLTFAIIMSIILMNLLVGLAVDDIKEVQQQAKLVRLGMQVKLTLDVEYSLPTFIRRRSMKKTKVILPNKHRYKSWLQRWILEDSNLSYSKINAAFNPESNDIDDIHEKVEIIEKNVSKVRYNLQDVNNRTKTLESMMKAVVKHMKVPYDQNDDDEENN